MPLPATVAIPSAAPINQGLPLRGDDVFSLALFLKIFLFAGLLLVCAYFILRAYARLNRDALVGKSRPGIRCETALRLSSRSKVYLLVVDGTKVLVTESASGTQAVVMGPVVNDQAISS